MAKNMKWLNQKIIIVFLLICTVNSFFLFIYTGLIYASDIEIEIWELKLTGDTVGEFKMQLKRVKNDKGFCEISGKFSGPMEDRSFGRGEMTCRVKGKIEKNVFEAKLSGSAEVEDGHVYLRGTMTGTISKFKGFGIWSIIHEWGSPEGKWIIKRISPSQ